MGQGLLVTGTDTGVGKTLTSCGLAYALRDLGYNIGVMKPAETGCEMRDGALFPQDAFYLQQSSGNAQPLDRICPYRFAEPLAPAVAAERTGQSIDLSSLSRVYRQMSRACDVTIVEGAGGLLVPLTEQLSYIDLAVRLGLPLVVVVGNRLGALNHALLTLRHASAMGLPILGYVVNDLERRSSPAMQTNPHALRRLSRVPCLGEVPFIVEATPALNGPRLSALFRERIRMDLLADFIRQGPGRRNRKTSF